MKVRIKSFNGDLPEWLTVGKVYDAKRRFFSKFEFMADDGIYRMSNINSSIHLNGGSWEVIND